MKFKFKKIASILAGTFLMSSTLAFAAAANYPDPFVKSGSASVGVVYGSMPGAEFDLLAVSDITTNLQAKLAAQTATGGSSSSSTSISGEAAPLFTGGTKLYMNDTLNTVKSSLSDTQLPNVLKDGSFSGNVDTTYTQSIDLGFNPQLTFAKQPTSSDDPNYALALSSTAGNYIYNATVTFNKAVNLTHADSEGQDLTLFGQKFTIASATDETKLVLLKTAEKVSLSSDAPTTEVTIKGKKYTLELVSASDSAATVKVTNEAGVSETKEINENASKKVNGITVAVTNADETNLKLSASVIAGAEKVTLSATAGSSVTYGEEDNNIDGTSVIISGGTTAATKIIVSALAKDSDHDALKSGNSFVDPVFGTFKLDFSGLSIPENSTARQDFVVSPNGDDKLQVKFSDYHGKEATISYVKNFSGQGPLFLMRDDDGHNISVAEMEKVKKDDYVVVGNEDEAALLKITSIYNSSTAGTSGDKISYTDVFTGESKDMDISANDGSATLNLAGKSYAVTYNGTTTAETNYIRINHPDSAGSNSMVIWPTIETSMGAKLMLYKPVNISNIGNWDGAGNKLTQVRIPDGDGYTDVTIAADAIGAGNITVGGTVINATSGGGVLDRKNVSLGRATATFVSNLANQTTVHLTSSEGNLITDPALLIFEEKDDNSNYESIIVTTEGGATADDGMGVSDVIRSFTNDASWDAVALASDSKKTKDADLWGTIALIDNGDSDQSKVTISYPDEQLYAEIYIAENSAEIVAGTVSGGNGTVKELGSVAYTDTSAPTGANLIVVGGSCVNKLAAELLGVSAGTCGAAWEQKTGVGAGSFLIQSFDRTGKVATLVAGYNAEDTRNAAKVLTASTVDTMAGKKYKSTSATAVQLVTGTSNTTA